MHHHVEESPQGQLPRVVYPEVVGLALLHPSLSGQMGPALSRLLSRSKLGRSILRPLLRTEVGEVSNRRSWHNMDKLTPEVGAASAHVQGREVHCDAGCCCMHGSSLSSNMLMKHAPTAHPISPCRC
jgi:hypothetical protein